MEYNVELIILTAPLSEEQLGEVARIAGAGGNIGGTRLEVTVGVEAQDLVSAVGTGIAKILSLVPGQVVSARASTIEEFERQERAAALREDLAGVAEVAAMLGVPKQRVTTLARRNDFPAPLQRLSSGPVWRRGDLSTFAAGWERKGGRPRKATPDAQPVAS